MSSPESPKVPPSETTKVIPSMDENLKLVSKIEEKAVKMEELINQGKQAEKEGQPALVALIKRQVETLLFEALTLRKQIEGETSPESTLFSEAQELLGRENVLGPEEVEKTFNVRLEKVPAIPFSAEDLNRAKKLNQMLVLRVDKTEDGQPLSLEVMNNILTTRWKKEGKGELLRTPEGWKGVLGDGFKNDAPRAGWALVGKEVLPNSISKNYVEQTELIVTTLEKEVFKGITIPKEYTEAIAEFESNKKRLTKLMDEDWKQAAKELSELKISKLTRPTAEEVIYDLALYQDTHNKRLLSNRYTWVSSLSSDGCLGSVGYFGSGVVRGPGWRPGYRNVNLGASFSRSM